MPIRTREILAQRAVMVCSCVWLALGCYQPEYSADAPDAGEQPLDAWVPPDEPDAGAEVDAGPPRLLSFRVKTFPVGGRFLPLNVGAIWVETGEGGFVRTLALWGTVRTRYLRRFQAASMGDALDAVTSATLTDHETHEVTWDLRDRTKQPLADGEYRLVVELTDRNAMGASTELPFTLGPEPFSVMPEDTAQFREMLLSVETLE